MCQSDTVVYNWWYPERRMSNNMGWYASTEENYVLFSLQARFWVQVMRDLRNGVKLKKVQERQYNPLPIEYQLTPYEMLMDDIRSKRYTLRKVMVSHEHYQNLSNPKCYFIFYFFFFFSFLHIDSIDHGILSLCSILRRKM